MTDRQKLVLIAKQVLANAKEQAAKAKEEASVALLMAQEAINIQRISITGNDRECTIYLQQLEKECPDIFPKPSSSSN